MILLQITQSMIRFKKTNSEKLRKANKWSQHKKHIMQLYPHLLTRNYSALKSSHVSPSLYKLNM